MDPQNRFNADQQAAANEATSRDEIAWSTQVLMADVARREATARASKAESWAKLIMAVTAAVTIGWITALGWGIGQIIQAIVRVFA